jgi:hypothetical protein
VTLTELSDPPPEFGHRHRNYDDLAEFGQRHRNPSSPEPFGRSLFLAGHVFVGAGHDFADGNAGFDVFQQ